MMGRKFINRVAASVAVAGMMFTGISDLAGAATAIKNGENVNGFIRTNSPSFTFKNQSLRGTPVQRAYGEEFLITAKQGDAVVAAVDVEDGSTLLPILVLVSSQTGAQVAYDDRSGLLRYRVPTTGEYKLRVLGKNNTRGRYTLSISGISQTTTSQNPPAQTPAGQKDARQKFLEDEYGLRVLENCPAVRSNVVVVTFPEYGQTYTYCANPNRNIKAGEYRYDVSSNDIKPGGPVAQNPPAQTPAQNDPRKQALLNEYGLRVLDTCPEVKTSLVVVTFTEYGQTYNYCANPNRLVKAGAYTFDISSGDLKPKTTTAQNPTQPTANDQRSQLLRNEYGLTVLDSCPPAKNSLVVVNFTEAGQTYTYCANPNRVFKAGEYTYNPSTRNLDTAKKPTRCTVEISGICIVR
jgi:hypothetical protein